MARLKSIKKPAGSKPPKVAEKKLSQFCWPCPTACGNPGFKCGACGGEYSGAIDRIRAHWTGSSTNTAFCPAPPPGARRLLGLPEVPIADGVVIFDQDMYDGKGKAWGGKANPVKWERLHEERLMKEKEAEVVGSEEEEDEDDEGEDEEEEDGGQVKARSGVTTLTGAPPPTLQDVNNMRQQTMVELAENDANIRCQRTIVRLMAKRGQSISSCRDPVLLELVRDAKKTTGAFRLPSRNTVVNKHMPSLDAEMDREEDALRASWDVYGVTISCDGWGDRALRPVYNAIATNVKGSSHLFSRDASGYKKGKDYIAAVLEEAIEAVGAERVVGVVCDNTMVNVVAMTELQAKYPNIFFQGCAAHACDLVLKDVVKVEWGKRVLVKAEMLAHFFRYNDWARSWLKKESNYVTLVSCDTRFASHHRMVERLLLVQDALENIVAKSLWGEMGSRRGRAFKERKATVKAAIRDEEFWEELRAMKELMECVLKPLRVADRHGGGAGEIYDALLTCTQEVQALEEVPDNWKKYVGERLADRWDQHMKSPLYAGARRCHPVNFGKDLSGDAETVDAWQEVVRCLVPAADHKQLKKEMEEGFQLGRTTLKIEPGKTDKKEKEARAAVAEVVAGSLPAHSWLADHLTKLPVLRRLAMRLHAQCCSSSACERSFSKHELVLTARRNRLGMKRFEMLVRLNVRLEKYYARQAKGGKVHSLRFMQEDEDSDDGAPGMGGEDEEEEESGAASAAAGRAASSAATGRALSAAATTTSSGAAGSTSSVAAAGATPDALVAAPAACIAPENAPSTASSAAATPPAGAPAASASIATATAAATPFPAPTAPSAAAAAPSAATTAPSTSAAAAASPGASRIASAVTSASGAAEDGAGQAVREEEEGEEWAEDDPEDYHRRKAVDDNDDEDDEFRPTRHHQRTGAGHGVKTARGKKASRGKRQRKG